MGQRNLFDGNTKLVDYGIQNEDSDLRAHVCAEIQTVYVYPTKEGIIETESDRYELKRVFTGNIETARGYAIPIDNIKNCIAISMINHLMWNSQNITYKDTTSDKGIKSVNIVKTILNEGKFPFMTEGKTISDAQMQINGVDITVDLNIKIQVKCDYRGGATELGGTGNLFLQKQECNPYKFH